MIYLDFYQLDHRPFAIQPDTAFLFWTEQHKSTFDALRDMVVSGAPFTMLTGEIGAGKTLLTNALSRDPDITNQFSICPITLPQCDASVIMAELITTISGSVDADDLWQEVCSSADHMRANDKVPLIIVDEAQKLSGDGAEFLGRLCTGDEGKQPPIQVLLVGQPELRSIVSTPDFRLLKSVLGLSVHLKPLTKKEVGAYINFRLQAAGAPSDAKIFEPETFPLIYKATKGVPRLINKLCEVCLFLASQKGEKKISADTLQELLANYVDPTTMSLTGSITNAEPPSPIITLQEPARKPRPKPEVVEEKPQPAVVKNVTQPPKEERSSKKWLIGGLVATVAYAISPIGPLPQDNGLMIALYGAPQSDDNAALDAPAAPSSPQPEAVALPALEQVHDPANDPAATHFEKAIAATDRQQIAVAYTRAAIRGHSRSAEYLGQLFETGDGVAFAPQVAARWYAVADDATLLKDAPSGDVVVNDAGEVAPLFSTLQDGVAEFIWHGKAELFQLEVGDSEGNAIAGLKTALTAALVSLPDGATQWRLRTNATNATDWIPIVAQQPD